MNQIINQTESAKEQYATSQKLSTRISIHEKYSVNKQGFGNWILSHYNIRSGAKLLELGCGTGSMWVGHEDMIQKCSRFVLSDFSAGMLQTAQEALKDIEDIEYQVIDIQNIPFPDDSFDIVIANMMLYHVPNLAKGLSEVRRVLKKGGTFYCATYGENGIIEYLTDLFQDYAISKHAAGPFTLQNGEPKLRSVFPVVERLLYEDSLAVTDVEDLVDYIYSLTDMTELSRLSRDTVRTVLQDHMQNGVLRVPKDYGMFISHG